MIYSQALHSVSPSEEGSIPFSVKLTPAHHKLSLSLRRIYVRLCETSFQLPPRLRLQGIRLENNHPYAVGSYGAIYKGQFCGRSVALKALRIFHFRGRRANSSEVEHLKVSHIGRPYSTGRLINNISS